MAEEMQNVTTGEVGSNANATNQSVDVETIVNNVFTAIANKNAKNEKSIVNDNFSKLSDDDKEAAFKLFNDMKNAEAEKATKAAKEKDDLIESMKAEIKGYKDKERTASFNNAVDSVLNELSITEEGSRKQALRLATAGVDVNDWFKEDGSVDIDKFKEVMKGITEDIPSLVTKTKDEGIKIKSTKPDDTDEALQKRQDAIRKRWGLKKD